MTEPHRKRRDRQREREVERAMMTDDKRKEEGKGGGERKHEIYTNIYEISCSKSCCSNKIQSTC